MKRIKLTKGKYALVDDEDFEKLGKHSWCHDGSIYGYAQSIIKGKHVRMHRLIMNMPKGEVVDHINGKGYDNRKINLRVTNRHINGLNRLGTQSNNTSGINGVSWAKDRKKWIAYIKINQKRIFIGYFLDKYIAQKAQLRIRELYI